MLLRDGPRGSGVMNVVALQRLDAGEYVLAGGE